MRVGPSLGRKRDQGRGGVGNKRGENGERDPRTGGICEIENRASRGEGDAQKVV